MTREEARLTLQDNFGYLSQEHPRILEALRVALDALPILPSNLDEAAEDSWSVYEYRESPRGLYSTCYVDGFKAGAEWLARQGETIEGEILTTSDYGWETIRIPKKLYPLGTKVTIQIRKKQ